MGDILTFKVLRGCFKALLFGIFSGVPSFVLGVVANERQHYLPQNALPEINFKSAPCKSILLSFFAHEGA